MGLGLSTSNKIWFLIASCWLQNTDTQGGWHSSAHPALIAHPPRQYALQRFLVKASLHPANPMHGVTVPR